MARQALTLLITMMRIAKTYSIVSQQKARGLQTMRDLLTFKRVYRKKSRSN